MVANLVQILNFTPVLGGSLVGSGSALGLIAFSNLAVASMNNSGAN